MPVDHVRVEPVAHQDLLRGNGIEHRDSEIGRPCLPVVTDDEVAAESRDEFLAARHVATDANPPACGSADFELRIGAVRIRPAIRVVTGPHRHLIAARRETAGCDFRGFGQHKDVLHKRSQSCRCVRSRRKLILRKDCGDIPYGKKIPAQLRSHVCCAGGN